MSQATSTACIDNASYELAATSQSTMIIALGVADAAITAAQSLYERFASSSISNLQLDIAKRQLKLAQHYFAHAKHFWEAETNLVNNTFSEPYYNVEPYYNYVFSTYVDSDSAKIMQCWVEDSVNEEVVFTQEQAIRFETKVAQERIDAYSFGLRQDEAKKDTLNERRYTRRTGVLMLGRGIASQASTYYGNALGANLGNAGIISKSARGLTRGALNTWGENTTSLNPGYFKNGEAGWVRDMRAKQNDVGNNTKTEAKGSGNTYNGDWWG